MFEHDYLNLNNHLKNSIVILINRKKMWLWKSENKK